MGKGFLGFFVLCMILLVLSIMSNLSNGERFQDKCTDNNGVPIYIKDGRWICIKKESVIEINR